MKYYALHIRDSGAVEFCDYKNINGVKTLVGNIYNDPEFNSLNDILHSTDDFIVNSKVLDIWKSCNIQKHDIHPARIKRVNRIMGPLGIPVKHTYKQLRLKNQNDDEIYHWIDYTKSHIEITHNDKPTGQLIRNHEEVLELIEKKSKTSKKINAIYADETLSNKEKKKETDQIPNVSWNSKLITFGKQFNTELDLFEIRLYSFGTYVSEKLRKVMTDNGISDIGYSESKEELGIPWRKHFPTINFNMNTYR